MKRIFGALLAVVMLFSVLLSAASCFGVSVYKMNETCGELKADGEIGSYYFTDSKDISETTGIVASISVYSADKKEYLYAVEYLERSDARKSYDNYKYELDRAEDDGGNASDIILKRRGNVVITSNSKELYKKVL